MEYHIEYSILNLTALCDDVVWHIDDDAVNFPTWLDAEVHLISVLVHNYFYRKYFCIDNVLVFRIRGV